MVRTKQTSRPAPKASLAGKTSTIKPQVTVLSDPNDIVSQLYNNKQKEFLTDKVIVFHGQSYPCHSSFISSFSPVLKEKLLSSDPEVNFPQLESIVRDADLFFQILDYCYGQPFQLTLKNVGFVLTLCSALQLSSLSDSIHNVVSEGFSKSRVFQLKSEEVLQTIKSSVQRDVMLSYKDTSLSISSLVLICSSEYFKNLLCLSFADSNERKFSYSEEFSGVSNSNFETFFKYFLGESFSLDLKNVVDFYQLSVYFSLHNLKETCNSFVSSLTSTTDIFTLLKIVSERNLLNFLRENLSLIGKLDNNQDLPSPFPLPLSFISLIIEAMSNSWVFQCLTLSITNEVFEEDYHILSQTFEKIVVNDQNITEIYSFLRPLFDHNYLHQFLFTWSMKVFQGVQNVHVIPDDWFLWCLSQSCLNHKRWKISNVDFFVQNFSLIIEASDLSKNFNHPYLTPQIFKNLKSTLPPSYDFFLVSCFVKTWKETELWTVKNFEDEILIVDFRSSVDNIEILNILSKLTTDSRLSPLLNATLLNQSLGTLNQHHQEMKELQQHVVVLKIELNEVKQRESVLSEELKDQAIFFKNELRSLRESVTPLIRIHEENERKRIEALNKAKAEEDERRRIQLSKNIFNSNSCGSKLSLSNNNTVVKKNGSKGCTNTFVEVNLTDNCSVKFTRLDNLHGDGDTDGIGWKDRGSHQDGSIPSPCIRAIGTYSLGSFSPSNPRFPTITRGESITVSFSNGKAYFKPSTSTTTFSVDIPSNLIFGMLVYGENHEWKVERV
ncbi:hypothetical protein GEMRC1_000669 [Eukaryota sp. GEM-RC1]